MVFENNLIYDSRNFYPIEFVDWGSNNKFNNNTIISKYYVNISGVVMKDVSPTYYQSRYGPGVVFKPAAEARYVNFECYNNVVAGTSSFHGDEVYLDNINEGNNIFWSVQ